MKKRILSLLLCAAMLLTLLPQTVLFASADDSGTCGTNLSWSYNSSTHTLTITGTGAMTNWGDYYDVPWHSYRSSIQSVSLPDGLTSIGDYAFEWCAGLTAISIPDSVTSIGDWAFADCTGLTAISIPDSVTSISSSAFYITAYYNNSSNWTDGVLYIGNHLIEAKSTKSGAYQIRTGTKTIADFAFAYCTGLTSITIPDSVTSIGDDAFLDCTGLTSITVAEGNSVYDSRNNCNAIIETATNTLIAGCKNTVIPSGVTSIGDRAFYNCTGLTAISIPDSVTSIGDAAFGGCTGLTAISIPSGVTSIGDYAFSGCTGLTAITIGNGVTSIGWCAFIGCTGLTDVYYPGTEEEWNAIDIDDGNDPLANATIHFGQTEADPIETDSGICGTNLRWSYNSSTYTLTITGSGSMNDWTWSSEAPWYSYCDSIRSVSLPDGLTSIGDYAFCDCTGLTAISIPDSVTSIGTDAFRWCTGLTAISIPDSVRSIGDRAFDDCTGLTSVTIGNGVTSIGDRAFSGCTGLTAIAIPDSVTSIGADAFQYCTGLTAITIPDSVTSIGDGAFYYCTGLTSITVAEGNSFYDSRNNCNAIIETATNTLIAGCKNTVIPDSVTSIGEGAFGYCSGLTAISIPSGVTSIGYAAFEVCTGLTSITIGNGVTSIGDAAFAGCTGLTAISIPDSVTSIGDWAFYGCTGLSHVHFLGSKPSIGAYAFSSCASDLTLCYLPETTGWENYTTYPAEEWDCTVTADCTSITYTCNTCGEAYTVIGEYHDWSLTETITAPTCTEAGSGVYTCAVCGRTKTEPILATGHSFVNGVCETCGEKLKIRSASLRISEDINVIYAVEIPEGCTDPYMVFTLNDRTYTVDTYTLNSKGQYCFELAAVTPQCMGDNISATLYATVDGCSACVTKAEYSVRAYCVNMLAKTDDDLFVTLLSDLLTYGAAAQTYTNYKTDTLVTDGLSLSPSAFQELSGLKEEFVGTADPDTIWKSASLTLRNNVDMNLFFHTDNIEGLSVVLEINGRTETVTDFAPVDGEEGLYQITFHGILATEFDLPVRASFYRDGAQVGNTLKYSVNTYICSKQHDGDAALAAMVRALYNYGATVNTYYFERYLVQ